MIFNSIYSLSANHTAPPAFYHAIICGYLRVSHERFHRIGGEFHFDCDNLFGVGLYRRKSDTQMELNVSGGAISQQKPVIQYSPPPGIGLHIRLRGKIGGKNMSNRTCNEPVFRCKNLPFIIRSWSGLSGNFLCSSSSSEEQLRTDRFNRGIWRVWEIGKLSSSIQKLLGKSQVETKAND